MFNVPKGVQGGGPALRPEAWLIEQDGSTRFLPDIVGEQRIEEGTRLLSLSSGGGGYGQPHTRDAGAVLADVVEGYVTIERAADVYGVVVAGDPAKVETLSIDAAATAARRENGAR